MSGVVSLESSSLMSMIDLFSGDSLVFSCFFFSFVGDSNLYERGVRVQERRGRRVKPFSLLLCVLGVSLTGFSGFGSIG